MVRTGQASDERDGSPLRDGAGASSSADVVESVNELRPRDAVACSADNDERHFMSADAKLEITVAQDSSEKTMVAERKSAFEESGEQSKDAIIARDVESPRDLGQGRPNELRARSEAELAASGEFGSEESLPQYSGNFVKREGVIVGAEKGGSLEVADTSNEPDVTSKTVDVSTSARHNEKNAASDNLLADARSSAADAVSGERKRVEGETGVSGEHGSSPGKNSVAEELEKARARALAALTVDVDLESSQKSAEASKPSEEDARHPPKRRRSRRKRSSRRNEDRKAVTRVLAEDGVSEAESETDDVAVEYITPPVNIPDGYGEFADVIANFTAKSDSLSNEIGNDVANIAVKDPTFVRAGVLPATENLNNSSRVVPGSAPNGIVSKDDGAGSQVGRTDATGNESPSTSQDCDQTRLRAGRLSDLSERRRRRQQRLTVAELKSLVARPELVEPWDVTAADPLLVVYLKSVTGSVVVPNNWRQKSKYLQSKRGMEKLPFKLPAYIEETGVSATRAAADEAEASKTAKQKGRERIRPKTGKGVDVDYSVLRDAFFKFQTKPRLTGHGDLYYELREREVNHERFRPGVLSAELREALGIGKDDPPPWLVAMQRYGPPPSYPSLVIPGLNAPIPPGASFGYHPGGWGKPPVDESGRPLYGDVFGEGTRYSKSDTRFDVAEEEQTRLWGEPEAGTEDDDRESLTGNVASFVEGEKAGVETPEVSGSADASGVPGELSINGGLATPSGGIQLRKGPAPGKLFDVLEERASSVGSTGMIGSSHVYVVPNNERLPDSSELGGADGAGAVASADEEMLLSKKRKVQEDAPPETSIEGRKEKKFKF